MIDGHTDGTDEHNQVLSENRARSLQDFFVTQANIDAARIRIHGYGEARPISLNDTAEGKERNRRVEIIAITVAK